MCLAMPMKLVEKIDDTKGTAELEGTKYDVDLSIVSSAKIGDFIIVHAGYAIEKLDEEEAGKRLELFEGMAKSYEEEQ